MLPQTQQNTADSGRWTIKLLLIAGARPNFMKIAPIVREVPMVEGVSLTEDTLSVELSDGRTIAVPLAWFPRLLEASQQERDHWRLIGKGQGIHWEDIDEDISVEGLLAGRPSGESQTSFKKWLSTRSTMNGQAH